MSFDTRKQAEKALEELQVCDVDLFQGPGSVFSWPPHPEISFPHEVPPLGFICPPRILIFFFILSQGIHFDPASAQTLRLEFARTNSRVSPKQQSYVPHQSAVNVANSPGPLPPARNGQCKLCQIEYHILHFNVYSCMMLSYCPMLAEV